MCLRRAPPSAAGAVCASPDEGESWSEVAEDLPDVMVVRAAALT